jgi:uncharacterized membrane protein
VEHRLHRHQICHQQCRSLDLSGDPHGACGGADGRHLRRSPAGWPNRAEIGHSIVAGILVHGFYLGGTAVAISLSIPAAFRADPGPAADPDIHHREPLARRARDRDAMGRAVDRACRRCADPARPADGRAGRLGLDCVGVSLVSITLGTLYQRRYCSRIDWRSGNLVQYIAVTVFFAIGAFLFEAARGALDHRIHSRLAWLAVALSIGSIGLLYWLIRHQAATSVASLFYLVPAVTSLMAFVLFDERLDAVAIAGMIACAAAVLLVNRAPTSLVAADRGVGCKRAFAACLVVDDRTRIGLAELDACACEFERRCGPGLMRSACRAMAPAPAPSA